MEPPASVRDALTSDTRLLVGAADSAGSLIAERRTHDGWQAGNVDLHVDTGELVARADGDTGMTIERFGLGLQPIDLPEEIFERPAQLVHVRAELAQPVRATIVWMGDDAARVHAQLALGLTWALEVDGAVTPLGNPTLPPVPVDIELGGDGAIVQAEVRASATGELWSWADLVKLEDLKLVLAAQTVAPAN